MTTKTPVQTLLTEKRSAARTSPAVFAVAPLALNSTATSLLSANGGSAIPDAATVTGAEPVLGGKAKVGADVGKETRSVYVNQVLFMAPSADVSVNVGQFEAAYAGRK